MVKLTIACFKSKNQDRIRFVQILDEMTGVGLKKSKLLMDEMLLGTPIEVQIKRQTLTEFSDKLNELNIEYRVS